MINKSESSALPRNAEKSAQNGISDIPKINLAPMADVGDRAFRIICRRFGADMLTTEMVSAKAICYGDKKTLGYLRLTAEEVPVALQLFGSEPEFMERAVSVALDICGGGIMPCAVDINMGCPVPKIVGGGDGSALLKNPALAGKVVEAAVKAADGIPVTVKTRIGWADGDESVFELAARVEEAGAAAICLHARTRSQQYGGKADISYIKRLKEAVKIPVIGNGDITCAADAEKMLSETGCDGIALARAALGHPWIFAEIKAALRGESYISPSPREAFEIAFSQLELAIADKGEAVAMKEFRKHFIHYTRGMPNSAALRSALSQTETKAQAHTLVNEFLSNLNEEENK